MGLFDEIFNRHKGGKQGKPDFTRVESGGSSTAPLAVPAAPVPGSGAGRTYTVVEGDSLSKIAQRQYGDASKWRTIYKANRDLIMDPDLIHPGQTLRIPEA